MNKLTTVAIAAITAAATTTVTNMVNYVELQATSPGTTQSGSLNISGTAIAKRIRVGTTAASGARIRVDDTIGAGGVYSKSNANGVTGWSTALSGQVSGGLFLSDST